MIEGVHHSAVIVSNMDNSIRFYRDTLGLKLLFTIEESFNGKAVGIDADVTMKTSLLKAGENLIELIQYVSPKGKPFDRLPCDVGNLHIAFRVSDIYALYDKLQKKGVKFSSSPNEETEGPLKGWIWVYLTDPDGVQVELVEQH